MSESIREAILTAVTVPASAEAPNESPDAAPAAARVAVHAVALRALLSEAPNVLPPCRATAPQGLARPTGDRQESCNRGPPTGASRSRAGARPSLSLVLYKR